jgi:hypothetical protein
LAFDEFGNEYRATGQTVAGDASPACKETTELIAGVPREVVLIFEDLAPDATLVSLLRIGTSVDGTSAEISAHGLPLE